MRDLFIVVWIVVSSVVLVVVLVSSIHDLFVPTKERSPTVWVDEPSGHQYLLTEGACITPRLNNGKPVYGSGR